MMRETLLGLPRQYKRLLQVMTDVLLVWLALWLSFYIRLGSVERIEPFSGHAWLFITAPILSIPLFIRLGLYRAVLRYLGNDALMVMAKAVTLSSLLLALAVYWYRDAPALVPRSMIFNYWWLSLMLIGGLRLLMRQYFLGDWYSVGLSIPFINRTDSLPRVAVYGAGSAGNQLVVALRMGLSMRPVAFIDDDELLSNRMISGLRVYRPQHIQQLIDETGVSEILLALPSVTHIRRREILASLECYPLRVRSVPNLSELASGRVSVHDLQEVDIPDLLGRDAVEPRIDLFERCIRQRIVMVTGAGGSIGSELCRQIATQHPKVLILFEHSEFNLYSIHRELEQLLQQQPCPFQLIPILGSIRDPARLLDVMRTWNVETLYHAAAYKHVPMVEHNVTEGVLNNVFGTLHSAQAAIQAHVRDFVLISTDKAVRPTNVMGCTKRLAEMLLQALSRESAPRFLDEHSVHQVNRTRFTIVRFGNVLGSSGSVIPLFREQIRRGGPVTVTHPDITRYFMTIPEAAQLVIQAGALGQGGEVFVLNMGEPVRIAELATKMIRLSGFTLRDAQNPEGDIPIQFTGLRPGEKLYEELLIGDNVTPTEHPMILCADEEHLIWEHFRLVLQELRRAVTEDDFPRTRQILQNTVSGYQPDSEIVDLIHQQRQQSLRPQKLSEATLGSPAGFTQT